MNNKFNKYAAVAVLVIIIILASIPLIRKGASSKLTEESTSVTEKSLLTGNKAKSSDSQTNSSTSNSTEISDSLPEFVYVGNDQEARLCTEVAKQLYSEYYDPADVMIPAPIVAYFEETDSEITVIANINIYGYDIDGTTLIFNNGGSTPCKITADVTDSGLKITNLEVANTDDETNKICGDDKDIISKLYDDNSLKSIRKSWIQMYVTNYNLDIDSYQDYGKEPVKLFDK